MLYDILVIGAKEPNYKGVHFSEGIAKAFDKLGHNVGFYNPYEFTDMNNFRAHLTLRKPIKISQIFEKYKIGNVDFIFIDECNFTFKTDISLIPTIYHHNQLNRMPNVNYPQAILYPFQEMFDYHSKQAYPWYFNHIPVSDIIYVAVDPEINKPLPKRPSRDICGIGYRRSIESWIGAGGIASGPTAFQIRDEIEEFKAMGFTFFDTPISDSQYRDTLATLNATWFPIAYFQYISRRILEAMASKVLCVIKLQDKRHREILERMGFFNGVHYFGIKKMSELENLEVHIELYPFTEMIENAYNMVLKNHTYKQRAKQVIDLFENKLSAFKRGII